MLDVWATRQVEGVRGSGHLKRRDLARRLGVWAALLLVALAITGRAADSAVVPPAGVRPVASGLPSQFSHFSWREQLRVPPGPIYDLTQTRDGHLWIGCRRGLVRFDGVSFTEFSERTTVDWANWSCSRLTEAPDGQLWIGTADGVLRYAGGSFVRFSEREGVVGRSSPTIRITRGGDLWAGGIDGLSRLSQGRWQPFTRTNGLESDYVLAFDEASDGTVWIGTFTGVQRHTAASGLVPGGLPPTGMEPAYVQALHFDQESNLWCTVFPHRGGGGHLMKLANGQWSEFPAGYANVAGKTYLASGEQPGRFWLPDEKWAVWNWIEPTQRAMVSPFSATPDRIFSMCEDREGQLWFGTASGELHCLRPRTLEVLTGTDGLVNDGVWSISRRRAGGLWIGTEYGISLLVDRSFVSFAGADEFAQRSVHAVLEDDSGRLWIGTAAGLYFLKEGAAGEVRVAGMGQEPKVRALYLDVRQQLWIGTDAGLWAIDASQPLPADASLAGGDSVGARLPSPRTLEGTNRSEGGPATGLQSTAASAGRRSPIRVAALAAYSRTNGLRHADVRSILEDGQGGLWVGTVGGLQRLANGKWTVVTNEIGQELDQIWSLHADARNVLWAGTPRGLLRIEAGRARTFGDRDGLFEEAVNEVQEDDLGHLWLGTGSGLYRVSSDDLNRVAAGTLALVTPARFDVTDGLCTNRMLGNKSQPAGCRTPDGRLWFPTAKGLAVVDPRSAGTGRTAPGVFIERVTLDGRSVDHLSTVGNAAGRTEVQWPQNRNSAGNLEIRYGAVSLSGPGAMRFRYRLEGFETAWVEARSNRVAHYGNLPPGRYTFHVTACEQHGVWSTTGSGFPFRIQAEYYETWWFRLAVAGLIVVALAAVATWRNRLLRRHHGEMQQMALAAERARIAKDLHDGLGANLTQLTLLAELAESDPRALAERLRQLSTTSRQAADDLKDFLWDTSPAKQTWEDVLARIGQTADDLLGPAGIQVRRDLPPSLPPGQVAGDLRQNLLMIVREALHNATKHSGARIVWIRARVDRGTMTIAVEDDGCGYHIPAEGATKARHGRGGHGLSNMSQRARELGGRLILESREGRGSKVSIEFPLTFAGHDRVER